MKKLLSMILVVGLVVGLGVGSAFAEILVDNVSGMDAGDQTITTTGQKFVTDGCLDVTKVTVGLFENGGSSVQVSCAIYTDNSGEPGTLLYSADDPVTLEASENGSFEFTFSNSSETLEAGTDYWVVLLESGGSGTAEWDLTGDDGSVGGASLIYDLASGGIATEIMADIWLTSDSGAERAKLKVEGAPLPVELASFNGVSEEGGIRLNWRTESEINNAGFYLYRDGIKLNEQMIDGQGTTTVPQNYTYLDTDVEAGKTYTYEISDIEEYTLKETKHFSIEVTYNLPADEDDTKQPAPEHYVLHSNYPNPFNPITTITFDLPEAVQVNLSIYDVTGQLVKTLVDDMFDAGSHPVQWNGTNEAGDAMSSGVYFYTITTDNFELNETKAMILMK